MMKNLYYLFLFLGSTTFLQAQSPNPSQLIKATWAKILVKYKPKKAHTEVVSFDPDPNRIDWPSAGPESALS